MNGIRQGNEWSEFAGFLHDRLPENSQDCMAFGNQGKKNVAKVIHTPTSYPQPFSTGGLGEAVSETNGLLEIDGKILYKSGAGGVYGLKT